MSPTSYLAALSRDIVAEEKGFEPLRRLHDLPVFKTGPFNQTWVFLHKPIDYLLARFLSGA